MSCRKGYCALDFALRPAPGMAFLAWGHPSMFRWRSILATAIGLAAFVAVMQVGTQWVVNEIANPEPLEESAARVQLVIDEQDVGLVNPETTVEARFAVANSGSKPLQLRQASRECCGDEPPLPLFTVEPGETGEVVAVVMPDELQSRGVKHVRFHTNDPASPELWLTVRGQLIRHAGAHPEEEAPVLRSVLVPR
jgi:hypothetical protein